ncbi:MAG: hypothetical protein P8X96_13935 [Desulfobacteraceae bacterium]
MIRLTLLKRLHARIVCFVMVYFLSAGLGGAMAEVFTFAGEVEPAYLTGDGDSTLGLSFKGSATRSAGLSEIRLLTHGTLALDEDVNPNPIVAELKVMKIWDRYKPPTGGDDPFGNPDEKMEPGYDKPDIELGLDARFETDQERENYNWAIGLEAAYIAVSNLWPSVPLTPSAYVNFEWVETVESDTQEGLGVDDEEYMRLRASVSLKYKVGEHFKSTSWTPLALHGDLRYYHDFDVADELQDADLDSDLYWAGAISYELGDPNSVFKNSLIDSVFLRVSGGRIPPETRDDTTLFLGVVISTDKKPQKK